MTDICRKILDRVQEFRVLGKEGAVKEMLKAADAYFRAEILAGQENAAGVADRIVLMLSQDLLSDAYLEEMPGDFVPIPNSYAEERQIIMAGNYACLPCDDQRERKILSDEEFGKLCRAPPDCSMTGTPIEGLPGLAAAFAERVMMQEDAFKKRCRSLRKESAERDKRRTTRKRRTQRYRS